MSTFSDRRDLFRKNRETLGLGLNDWARIFGLGDASCLSECIKKEKVVGDKGGRRVNKSEALASELLKLIDGFGYDVSSIEFTKEGRIKSIKEKVVVSGPSQIMRGN